MNGADTFALPPERLLESGEFNVRIFFGDIDQLAIQLMTEGQRDPLKVQREDDRFYVIDGHRRKRAFDRSRKLRIEKSGGKYLAFEDGRPLREAPGPVHRRFDPSRIDCRLVDPSAFEGDRFASQMIYNSGKPFTLLERMIFISRLSRTESCTRDQLALKTGFSRTHIANALSLNAADPRLLDYVREGRISQKLALRLLRAFPSDWQVEKICAAMADAGRHHRDKILPKDFDWGDRRPDKRRRRVEETPVDPVRARLWDVVARMGDAVRFAPNPMAQDRLGTLMMIHRYATGKLDYSSLESHLLGQE